MRLHGLRHSSAQLATNAVCIKTWVNRKGKMSERQQYQQGRLYQWTGSEFVELEPSQQAKLHVTEEAADAVKAVRKAAQAVIGMRPELSIVASAMLLQAARLADIAHSVAEYGRCVYASAAHVASDSQLEQQSAPEAPQSVSVESKPVSSYL